VKRSDVRDGGPSGMQFSTLLEAPGTGLIGPSPDTRRRPKAGLGVVTGGGLVAALDPLRGLVGLWRGRDFLLSGVEMWEGGRRARPTEFRWGGGAWTGEYDVGGGVRLIERGLLPDSGAAAVFEWTVKPPAPLEGEEPSPSHRSNPVEVRVVFVAGGTEAAHETGLSLGPGASIAVAVIPSGADAPATQRLVTPLRARERQRSERGRLSHEEGFSISRNGRPLQSVVEALCRIDDAAVAGPGHTAPLEIIGAFALGIPAYLGGEALALFGTAAVYSGRTWLAARVLSSLESAARTEPVPYLSFAATYALWTADLGLIAAMMASLTAALDALERGRAGAADVLPALAERLAAAIEPLGDRELSGRLRVLARRPAAGTGGPGSRTGRSNTLTAARFLRRVVESDLGLEADVSYGRLRFAPRLAASRGTLEVAGVRAGDSRIRLGISVSDKASELRILQEGGRVPLNLVFAPWLPTTDDSLTVLLDGSRVEPEVRAVAGGTRVQMQFPLDRPREVVILTGRS